MAEYISREELIEEIEEEIEAGNVALDEDVLINKGLKIALKDIKRQPAADVKTVIHAEWILFDKDCCGRAFYCSNCRKVTTTDDFENTPLEREEYFCPRCGADMRNE